MRAKEQKARKEGFKECKEQILCPLWVEISQRLLQEVPAEHNTFWQKGGCYDDSPRVKSPIETTAQCVYFLHLSIWCHYSSFTACACQPHHLQTCTKKCRCSRNQVSDNLLAKCFLIIRFIKTSAQISFSKIINACVCILTITHFPVFPHLSYACGNPLAIG